MVIDINEIKPYHKDLEKIISKFKNRRFSIQDAEELMQIPIEADWDWFFNEIGDIRLNNFKNERKLKIYTPGKIFPAISVTGTDCSLKCEHCDKKYLSGIIQAETENIFKEELNKLINNGAIGALLSGGCTENGKVPLLKFSSTIKEFKNKHKNFYFNSHIGLVNEKEASKLKEIGINDVSFDMNLDQKVINEVFHLTFDVNDYKEAYDTITDSGLRIVPHLLIGAYFGRISKELEVIKFLINKKPKLFVLIAMIPPRIKGKIASNFTDLNPVDICKIVFIAKSILPNTELSLGCMRPRGKISFDLERWSILAGVDRMEIPSNRTRKWLTKENFIINYFGACCAISNEFESEATALDIRGNLLKKII